MKIELYQSPVFRIYECLIVNHRVSLFVAGRVYTIFPELNETRQETLDRIKIKLKQIQTNHHVNSK